MLFGLIIHGSITGRLHPLFAELSSFLSIHLHAFGGGVVYGIHSVGSVIVLNCCYIVIDIWMILHIEM